MLLPNVVCSLAPAMKGQDPNQLATGQLPPVTSIMRGQFLVPILHPKGLCLITLESTAFTRAGSVWWQYVAAEAMLTIPKCPPSLS